MLHDFFLGIEHSLAQFDTGLHNDAGSGVSRCFPGVCVYSFFGPPGGARRWHQH